MSADVFAGIRLDEELKLDYLDGYYAKRKSRADIYMMKGLLDEAASESHIVVDKRRELIQPPHFKFTISLYQLAKIYLLLGDEMAKKGDQSILFLFDIIVQLYFRLHFFPTPKCPYLIQI